MAEARAVIAAMPVVMRAALRDELASVLEAPIPAPDAENPFFRRLAVDLRAFLPASVRQVVRLRAGTACARCHGSGRFKGGNCFACKGTALNAYGRRVVSRRVAVAG